MNMPSIFICAAMSELQIEDYKVEDARAIADLYHAAVHAIEPTVYSEAQKEAWAPTPPDYIYWANRLAVKKPFVARVNQQIVGFMELEADGHIDCAYTHPDFQGKGIGTALYQHLETQAKKAKLTAVYVEASIIARPFFENQGFHYRQTNSIEKAGQTLTNFTLYKSL